MRGVFAHDAFRLCRCRYLMAERQGYVGAHGGGPEKVRRREPADQQPPARRVTSGTAIGNLARELLWRGVGCWNTGWNSSQRRLLTGWDAAFSRVSLGEARPARITERRAMPTRTTWQTSVQNLPFVGRSIEAFDYRLRRRPVRPAARPIWRLLSFFIQPLARFTC